MPSNKNCKPDFPVQYRVATYSLNLDDTGSEIQFDSSTAITANLPAVVDAKNGYNVLLRNIGTADLTIDPSGSELIDGASTSILATDQWRWVRSDGTGWKTISRYVPSSGLPAPDFVSSEQTVTASTLLTVAHSLGAAPTLIQVVLRCKTADHSWSVGDEIPFYGAASGTDSGATIGFNSTNVIISQSSDINVNDQSSQFANGITVTSWRWVIRAWK